MIVSSSYIFNMIAVLSLQVFKVQSIFLPNFTPDSLISTEEIEENEATHFFDHDLVQFIDKNTIEKNNVESALMLQSNREQQRNIGCAQCACGTVNRKMRIVGGVQAEQHEFPWMVALSRKGKFYCGATVITKQHILTAAHCVEGFTAQDIKASLGEYNRALKNESSKSIVKIKQIIRHPDFQILNFKNDIAILKLESEIPFYTSHIQPACLPRTENKNYTGITATVAGWGRTAESKPTSDEMRKVEVPIMSNEECRKKSGYTPFRITDKMMCAGFLAGQKDACQGDSGGPLQIQGSRPGTMEVIGIVSWGRGCARPTYPGVYTRIESYMQWINSNLGEGCTCKN